MWLHLSPLSAKKTVTASHRSKLTRAKPLALFAAIGEEVLLHCFFSAVAFSLKITADDRRHYLIKRLCVHNTVVWQTENRDPKYSITDKQSSTPKKLLIEKTSWRAKGFSPPTRLFIDES